MQRAILPVVLATTLATSATAQVSQSLKPDRDNSLYEEGFASNGAGTRMFTGYRYGGSRRRAVLHFDVDGMVPAGAAIVSAELEVEVVQTISGPHPQTLHRATSDWGEGTSFASGGQGGGATPTPGDTTWTERVFPGVNWTTPGGDFVATASGSTTVAGNGRYTFASTPELVADVQAWLDNPAANYGWFIIGDETPNLLTPPAKALATREDSGRAPRLNLTYTVQASTTPFGTSCGTMPLVLSAQGVPMIGTTTFSLALNRSLLPQMGSSPPRADCLFGRAGLTTPIPLPGIATCDLWLDPSRLLPVCAPFTPGATSNDSATLAIGIPNDPALEGEQFYTQAIQLSSGQLLLSNGMELRIGR